MVTIDVTRDHSKVDIQKVIDLFYKIKHFKPYSMTSVLPDDGKQMDPNFPCEAGVASLSRARSLCRASSAEIVKLGCGMILSM